MRQTFELLERVDVVSSNPSSFDPYPCTGAAEEVDYFGDTSTAIAAGDVFDIDLDGCSVLGGILDGGVTLSFSFVNADAPFNSYIGRIDFSDLELVFSSGDSITLDGILDYGIDVTSGEQAILIEDSNLDVVRHDGIPANQVTENYRNLDLEWSLEFASDLLLEIDGLDVDSEAFDGSFSVRTPTEVERPVTDTFPTLGVLLFEGGSNSSYRLTADAADNSTLLQSLDSDGNGEDAVQPATAPTWQELFPEDFLVPIP